MNPLERQNKNEFFRCGTYQQKKSKLIINITQTELELDKCKRVQQDLSGWITRIKECLCIDTLTRAIAVKLISRIEVGETYAISEEKTLDLEIFYRLGLKNCKKKTEPFESTMESTFQKALSS